MARIRITRTITVTDELPFSKEVFPDCETTEDAVKFEEDTDPEVKIEVFVQMLEGSELEDIKIEDKIEVVE